MDIFIIKILWDKENSYKFFLRELKKYRKLGKDIEEYYDKTVNGDTFQDAILTNFDEIFDRRLKDRIIRLIKKILEKSNLGTIKYDIQNAANMHISEESFLEELKEILKYD